MFFDFYLKAFIIKLINPKKGEKHENEIKQKLLKKTITTKEPHERKRSESEKNEFKEAQESQKKKQMAQAMGVARTGYEWVVHHIATIAWTIWLSWTAPSMLASMVWVCVDEGQVAGVVVARSEDLSAERRDLFGKRSGL